MAELGRGRAPRLHDADLGNSFRMAITGNAADNTWRCGTSAWAGGGRRSSGWSRLFDGWRKTSRRPLRSGRSGVFRSRDNLESVAASPLRRRAGYVASRAGMPADGHPWVGIREAGFRRAYRNRVGRFDLHYSGWDDDLLPDVVRHASLFASGDGVDRHAARSPYRGRISRPYIWRTSGLAGGHINGSHARRRHPCIAKFLDLVGVA